MTIDWLPHALIREKGALYSLFLERNACGKCSIVGPNVRHERRAQRARSGLWDVRSMEGLGLALGLSAMQCGSCFGAMAKEESLWLKGICHLTGLHARPYPMSIRNTEARYRG